MQEVRDAIFEIDNNYHFVILGDVALAYPAEDQVAISPVVQACTLSRLFDDTNDGLKELFDAENTISLAQGYEREAIQLLNSNKQAVGGHYHLWYGLTLLNEKRYDEACQEFIQAIQCRCNHWRVSWYFAEAISMLGNIEHARKSVKAVVDHVPGLVAAQQIPKQINFRPTETPDACKAKSELVGIMFSKDRAMQLDGTLRSFLLHCQDYDLLDLKVIYTTSNQIHEKQYHQLIKDYERVEFVKEENFREDLISLLKPYRYVLFLVDDNIFVNEFLLKNALNALDNNPYVIGFSLRLGRNVTHRLYPEKRRWIMPEFETEEKGIIKFNWTNGDLDMGFGYPLEVSSSIYRVRDLYLLLKRTEFSNPNTLELVLDRQKDNYKGLINDMLCYETSVTFCNPLNLFKTAWKNYAGESRENSSETLAEKFEAGYRIDIDAYTGFIPHAYHQEVELKFLKSETREGEAPGSQYVRGLISIIILNFNGEKDIRGCLESIRACATEPYELIIIDNASTDGSLEYLRTLKDITLVENPENLGCPPARTQAMALARGEYVVLLDNDTIVTPGWLTTFCGYARRNPTIGLFGPCSNHVTGLQKVDEVPYEDVQGLEAFARTFSDQNRGCLTIVPRLVGFCMFIRRAVVDRIGAPDPRFGKFGFEDDDYTWRAIIAGFQAAIAQDVFIHHIGGPQVKGDTQYNRYLLDAWEIFKSKWDLPKELECGTPLR